ncbi:MAG: acetylornithine deacetylase [Gammaproteobacteria bacterium]|nr:acetylornithine deacetylase [Gammaproteobacteria bacterium]
MTFVNPLLKKIAALIELPSVSSVNPSFDMGNRAVVERLAEWYRAAGFVVEVLPLAGQPNKANMVATLGSGAGGLLLSGHTDTVPCNEELWQSNPFSLSERDGKLYGLGTADMKSFLVLALEAASLFTAGKLLKPLTVIATADEESSMAGAKALLASGRSLADFAVIGEPTGLRPVRMHKGVMMEGVRLIGQAGHSSNPAYGNSALEGMNRLMTELLLLRDELQLQYQNPAFEVPVPTLNLGHICGGDNPNRICGQCDLSFDLRPLPGMKLEQSRKMVRERLSERMQGSGLSLEFESLFDGIPALETAKDSEIVTVAERLSGYESEAVAFGTEAPYLTEMGMQVVVMGPGDIAQAHQPDEFLRLDALQPTVDLLQSLINHFCLHPAS